MFFHLSCHVLFPVPASYVLFDLGLKIKKKSFQCPFPDAWGLQVCTAPINAHLQLVLGGSGNCWDRAEPLRGAEMVGGLRESEAIIWGTGKAFGKVCLDLGVMSARHLRSSFTAASQADSTPTWQIHTSHCGCLSRANRSMLGGRVSSVCACADAHAGLCTHILNVSVVTVTVSRWPWETGKCISRSWE